MLGMILGIIVLGVILTPIIAYCIQKLYFEFSPTMGMHRYCYNMGMEYAENVMSMMIDKVEDKQKVDIKGIREDWFDEVNKGYQ